jgi:putative tryptophan/tyrosine transport system substrate-binding protein
MRRREFIAGLGAAGWPLAVRGQQGAVPVIGFVATGSAEGVADFTSSFRKGLSEIGYVEGQSVSIEYGWANDQPQRLKGLVADMLRRKIAVLAATSTDAVLIAKEVTSTIPIIFVSSGDPVRYGLVASLNRPGGNVTGATFITLELAGKRLQLLRALLPSAMRVGFLNDPLSRDTKEYTSDVIAAGTKIGMQVLVADVASGQDFEAAFAGLAQRQADALLIGPFPVFLGHRKTIVSLAERHRLPTFYNLREFTAIGGLLSYGASLADTNRQAGVYTGLVLRGAKPADLPVMQPTKFQLVINLKTAKALGLNLPPTLLALADEVIE